MELDEQNRTYHEVQESMALLPNYFAWTYGRFRKYVSGVVVELGCGAGLGIRHYASRADVVYAVDHDPRLMSRVQSLVTSVPIYPIVADLLEDWTELAHLHADTVIMMDVLEHFRDDRAFISKAAALLKPRGAMIIKVPANRELYSSVDRASGHYRRYDTAELRRLADSAGLRVRVLRQINPLGAIAYRMKSGRATNFSRTFSPLQLKLMNLAMPIISIGDLVPALPGLSVVCVMDRAEQA